MKYNSDSRKGLVNIESEILKLYDKDLSIKSMCKELNVSKSTIHNYLKKNGRRRYKNHNFNALSFSTFTPESCYWAGFIAADGCIDARGAHLRVELNIKDKQHIENLLKFVQDDMPHVVSGTKEIVIDDKQCNVNFCRADINSVQIIKNLSSKFNIAPNKSFTILAPDNIPDSMVKHYIRGYFDGDGSIYWNKPNKCIAFNISSGSAKLLNWMAKHISDNVDYGFAKYAFKLRKNNNIYCIEQRYNSAKLILDWLYLDSSPDTRLARKYKKYIELQNLI